MTSATIVALLVLVIASACRWTAYRERVRPPRAFSPTELGWWVAPLPAPGEFRTAAGRRFEVVGRGLSYVALTALWYAVTR